MKQRLLYKKAIEKWGVKRQLDKLEEELVELLLVVKRKQSGREVEPSAILDELVDVDIMIEQARMLYGIDDKTYYKHKERKKIRLEKRL